MDKRPTIIDVAHAAGVSKSLVSRAIRGEPGVSARTRARILEVADALGYRSNQWARSLKLGQTDLIGVLLTDLDNTYHTDVVHGIESAATDLGLGVVLSHGRRDAVQLTDQLAAFRLLGVDGLIVISALLDGPTLASIVSDTPLVVVGRPDDLPPHIGAVANHDERGARQAVEHLVSLGHRRIAHVQGSRRPASRARRAAYEATMGHMALADQVRVVPMAGVDHLIDQVVDHARDAPTAVFGANDRIAVEVLGRAIDAGLTVPEDLSIVGYDNATSASIVRPQLTTVDQPRWQMGRDAMHHLAELMCGAAGARQRVLQPTLVVRASTAPPRGEGAG